MLLEVYTLYIRNLISCFLCFFFGHKEFGEYTYYVLKKGF